MWTAVKVLDHRKCTHNAADLHVKVKVLWKNGEVAWVRMQALQLQDPYLLIEYAVQHKLMKHGEWSWVLLYVNNDKTLNSLATILKTTRTETKYKFGIEVLHSVRHAIQLNIANGNHAWQEAMDTELMQINKYATFRELTDGDSPPADYKKIPYQMIFDVKFDLRHKARLVAGGHKTDPPKEDIFSGVVGMETVRIRFLLATVNTLDVCAADIGNAFLYGKTKEKVFIIAGPEFGAAVGKPLIIDKGLYGLRSSSARFHEHLAAKLRLMGY